MMNILKSNHGFSLMELMIGSGLLMIGMYALADIMVLNARVQRNSTSESEISAIFDRVQKIAGSEWSCTAGLAGNPYREAITVKDPINTTQVVASESTGSTSIWSLTQVRMLGVEAVTGQPGVLRGSLYLEASKNTKLHLGVPKQNRSVQDIYFEVSADGLISRCYTTSDTIAAAQSACQLLGGTWDANQPTGKQCTLAAGAS